MYTKKELVGRKFIVNNINNYTFIENSKGEIGLEEECGTRWFNDYSIHYCNRSISSGIWILLPEEPKTYTTPKGIKYGVGTKYFVIQPKYSYIIDGISEEIVHISGTNIHNIDIKEFERGLDDGSRTIIQDYQQVDPSTIKFDFTNTKIRVNSPEESKWVIKAAIANNAKRLDLLESAHKRNNAFYFKTYNTTWDSGFNFEDSDLQQLKEITIQDILNSNQMTHKFKVGDIIEAKVGNTTIQAQIISLYLTGGYMTNKGFIEEQNAKLVEMGEIVGYELLKDLPGIPSGLQSKGKKSISGWNFHNNEYQIYFTEKQVSDTNWFKPIYKAKEVVVKISKNREVRFEGDKVKMGNQQTDIYQIKQLHKFINPKGLMNSEFSVSIINATIKVGCQEFTKEDIELVYKATQDFK